MKPLDLVPLVRAVAGSFASRAEQADVDFSVHGAGRAAHGQRV